MLAVRNTLFFIIFFPLFPLIASSQEAPAFELATSDGYRISIFSRLNPLQINRIHSWELAVTDASGNAVQGATLTVTGGMPDHDHGLPTNPQVTGKLANGRYLLEGVRFHMPGRWVMHFTINGEGIDSSADLEFTL